MRGTAVVNRQSGGLAKLDLDAFSARLVADFAARGHTIDIRAIDGADLIATLDDVARDPSCDLVIAAGGDGTLSATAGMAWRAGKVFAPVPGGTMNLVSRSLGLPQDPLAAAVALADGSEGRIDIATANDRPFLHEFSVGFRPRMVKTRQAFRYESRIGKMLASLRALIATASRPPVLRLDIETDADKGHQTGSLVAVSNNLFGAGHFAYADRLDEGVLGLYCVGVLNRRRNLSLMRSMILGQWQENPNVTIRRSRRVRLSFDRLPEKAHCVIDGELMQLEDTVTLESHPGALRCLMPRPGAAGAAA